MITLEKEKGVENGGRIRLKRDWRKGKNSEVRERNGGERKGKYGLEYCRSKGLVKEGNGTGLKGKLEER